MDIGKYWRTIIDSAQEGFIIVDPGGRLVAVNQATLLMTGYREDELIGKTCKVFNCSGCFVKGEGKGKKWCGLFSKGIMKDKKCLITTRHNRSIQVLKSASVLYDEDGTIVGAVETLKDITENVKCRDELLFIKKMYHINDGFHGIIGKTPVMQSMFELIENVASSDTPVMILGPSGTGKELVARAVHEVGSRCSQPFVKVNCAALNQSLLESELFGHVKGAYTGADKNRIGRFEAAHGGTIFLDEIGDIPLSTQIKLLRVLEEKKIEKVGDNRSISVDVRIITATNRDLEDLMAEQKFREDFFFRINVFPIICPSLEKRVADIPLIIQHFVNVFSRKTGKKILGLTPGAMELMMAYPWPGNVRELRNIVEYAFVLCHGNSIGSRHLPEKIIRWGIKKSHPRDPMLESERNKLIDALKQTNGNQTQAAGILGVSRITVWKRIKKHAIDLALDI